MPYLVHIWMLTLLHQPKKAAGEFPLIGHRQVCVIFREVGAFFSSVTSGARQHLCPSHSPVSVM